jgi:hypothetical protein
MVDQLDAEKMARQGGPGGDAGPEGTGSALPGLVRELIRTPGFKELLLIHLRDINPGSAGELVKAAIWEDVAFTMSALGASPKLVNWLTEALVELGVQLGNFTLDILRDFLVQLGRDFDIERLRELPAAYAPLVNELLLEDREALDGLIAGLGAIADELARSGERAWRKIWNTADFGKIRVGLTSYFDGRRAELQGEPDLLNPVAISNLLVAVPPLANFMLRVLTRTTQALKLPAEILANAVFQLLEDVDMAELGGLINAVAGATNALHRGNLVLGRDEPRLKEVLGRVSRELVENVDGEVFKDMLVSLKEDGAVIGTVVADYVYATPEATAKVARGIFLAVGAALRAAVETSRRLKDLPASVFESAASSFAEAVDPHDLAAIVNYQAMLLGRMFEASPEMLGDFTGGLLAGLDTEELAAAGKEAATQVVHAAMADPAISAALEPEAVGEMINKGLEAFNRFAWSNPGLMVDKAARTLAVLDMDQLVLAVGELIAAGTKALLKNPTVVKKALKPLARPAAIAAAAGAVAAGALAGAVLIIRKARR